jgi:diguanylate cyclase (GGDEF)-like protein
LKAAPTPPNEISRVATLRLLNILDTQPEERFDRLTRLAKRLFGVPIAQVTLIDQHRQWFKSGAGDGPAQTSREVSFCAHAILDDKILMVADAMKDERFADNPLVLGDPNIRFYAGCPLKVGDHNLGTLCVIDDKPRQFTREEIQLLKDLGDLAEQELTAVHMASTDHLTAISNRRGFESLAGHALAVCHRMGQPATILFFDLDKFKLINDVHGHAAGDRALRTFAHGLISVFRESDVVGRLGGDEFAVLLTGSTAAHVPVQLSRLQHWIAANFRPQETGYAIHFSAGQIEYDPRRHPSIESLLAHGDSAMYKVKRASLNRS